MLAVEHGSWKDVQKELGTAWRKIADTTPDMPDLAIEGSFPQVDAISTDKLQSMRHEVGETPMFDMAERGKVLRFMAQHAAARAAGRYPARMALCVAGARGNGKSKVLVSLLGGIHWTFNEPVDPRETAPLQAVYTGYLDRPLWIVPDPACGDDIFSLPPIEVRVDYVTGALPMPLVHVAIEILRAQGVDVPGSIRELPGARPGSEKWFCWSTDAFSAGAYGVLSEWLKEKGTSVLMVLDEWQDNFLEQVPETWREQLIGQLTWQSKFREPEGNPAIFTVFAGSSLDVVPAITRSGEVRDGDASLRRIIGGENIVIPPRRMGCHPHRVSVAHFWPFQSIEQVLQFLGSAELHDTTSVHNADVNAVGEVKQEMPGYLKRIVAAQGEARVELLLTELVPGARQPLPDLIEETGANPRLIKERCLRVDGDTPNLLLHLDLVSNARIASVYWALLWAMKRTFKSRDDHMNPMRVSMRSQMVPLEELRYTLGLLHEFAEEKELKEPSKCIIHVEDLTQDLVRDWASDGKLVVGFTNGDVSHVGFPTTAHYRAAVRLAATYEVSLHPRYAMAIMNPVGKLARKEGEYLLSATLARRLTDGRAVASKPVEEQGPVLSSGGRTVASQLVEEQGAVSSFVDDGVVRALVEEDLLSGLPQDRAHAKAFAHAMWRLGKVGDVAVDQSVAGVGDPVGSIAALDEAERRVLAKEGFGDDASLANIDARQHVLRTATACALGDFPSAWTASTSAHPLSEAVNPLRWNPDAESRTPMEPGKLYLRDGLDKGIDALWRLRLTKSIVLYGAIAAKLGASDSKSTKMQGAKARDIALRVQYDMTAGGVGSKMGKDITFGEAKYVVNVLFVMTNWRAGPDLVKKMAAGMRAAEVYRSGEALDWRTAPADLVRPRAGDSNGVVQNTLLSQFGREIGRADNPANAETSSPDDGAPVDWKLEVEGGERFKPSVIPRGGIAVVTTEGVLAPLWPLEVRAFAQEHGLPNFGAMSDDEQLQRDLVAEKDKRVLLSVWSRKSKAELEREKRKAEERKRQAEEEAAEAKRIAEERKRQAEEEAAEAKHKLEEEKREELAALIRDKLPGIILPSHVDALARTGVDPTVLIEDEASAQSVIERLESDGHTYAAVSVKVAINRARQLARK